MTKLKGTAHDDVLLGGKEADRIEGLGGKDQLHGGGGNDQLIGGDGRDILFGEGGKDHLTGGKGNDLFYFFDNDKGDTVTDFSHQQGDQFHIGTGVDFIGNHAFTLDGTEQARAYYSGGHTIVEANLDDDPAAEVSFQLEGRIKLSQSDFDYMT